MKYFFTIVGSMLLALAFFFLLGWTIMTLWNLLIPEIFGLNSIGFWQAMGLLLLSRILLGGFGGGGWSSGNWQQKKDHWKHKMQERWSEMSEEEKAEWKNRLSRHCSNSPKVEESTAHESDNE